MIREIVESDIDSCAELLINAYNCEPWNNNWTQITANRYLHEFFNNINFIGYVYYEKDILVGAIFAHRRTWWTNDEIYVDELFIKCDEQGKGYGTQLLSKVENCSYKNNLGGVTLLTNKYFPAKDFYDKRSYSQAEHVVFMYKET